MEQWKNSPRRKPLILRGARQVGKTWVMKEFGNRYFKNVAYINFDNNSAMKAVFESDFEATVTVYKTTPLVFNKVYRRIVEEP